MSAEEAEQPKTIIDTSANDAVIELSTKEKCRIFWLLRPFIWVIFLGIALEVAAICNYKNVTPAIILGMSGFFVLMSLCFVGNKGWKDFGKLLLELLGFLAIGFICGLAILFFPITITYFVFQGIVGKEYNNNPTKRNCGICWKERPSTFLTLFGVWCSACAITFFVLIIMYKDDISIGIKTVLIILLVGFMMASIWSLIHASILSGKEWIAYKEDLDECKICWVGFTKCPKQCFNGIVSKSSEV